MERAFVLTVSDGVVAGTREDASGRALEARLVELGYRVARDATPDEPALIAAAVRDAIRGGARLVMTTGGTGLGPRDRTPEALSPLLDAHLPGFGEVMRAEGRKSTPLADLSRSFAGVLGGALVIGVPGSPRGALESLSAVEAVLEHALETLAGRTAQHPIANDEAAAKLPGGRQHPLPDDEASTQLPGRHEAAARLPGRHEAAAKLPGGRRLPRRRQAST